MASPRDKRSKRNDHPGARCHHGNMRQWCYMTTDDPEYFPITYSTAYLALAALITMRANTDDQYDDATIRYVTRVLNIIKAQPETVLLLPPAELEEMGPHLLDNAPAWLGE